MKFKTLRKIMKLNALWRKRIEKKINIKHHKRYKSRLDSNIKKYNQEIKQIRENAISDKELNDRDLIRQKQDLEVAKAKVIKQIHTYDEMISHLESFTKELYEEYSHTISMRKNVENNLQTLLAVEQRQKLAYKEIVRSLTDKKKFQERVKLEAVKQAD